MTLARRLLPAAGGGGGFAPPPSFTVSGPYDPALDVGATVLTQLHCHTTGSDGDYTPTEVMGFYLAAGYGALMLTDHNVVTAQPAGIATAITGQEHSVSQQHIIVINSDYTSGATDAQTIVNAIIADGGEAEIAHPNWSVGMSFAELAALTDYLGIEVHNAKVVSGAGADPVDFPGYALDLWDNLLTNDRRDVWGFSVDDLHWLDAYNIYDIGRLWVFVETNSLANIMASLVSGTFVADVSNHGVTPGYPLRSGSGLALSCPGAVRIEAWGSSGLLASEDGDTIAYPFDGTEPYVRLVAVGDYTEAFGSALSDRWEALDGTWNVTGGTLQLTSDGNARRMILRRQRQGAFTAQVDMKVSAAGTDTAALLFNVLDSNHFYMLRIGESIVSGFNNVLSVAVTETGGFAADSALDTHAFDPTSGVWYTVKMDYTAAGRIQAKVWERGTSEPGWQLDVTDTTWTFGAFGLRANQTAEYDNLYITGFQTFYQPVAVD